MTENEKEGAGHCTVSSEMQEILARVRQNFGKINVVPQFSGDDLVPVEMSELDEELESLSAGEEEEEEELEQPGVDEEEPCQEPQESLSEATPKQFLKPWMKRSPSIRSF